MIGTVVGKVSGVEVPGILGILILIICTFVGELAGVVLSGILGI